MNEGNGIRPPKGIFNHVQGKFHAVEAKMYCGWLRAVNLLAQTEFTGSQPNREI